MPLDANEPSTYEASTMLIGQLVSQLGLHPGWCISWSCVSLELRSERWMGVCVWLASPGTSQWNKPLKRTNSILIISLHKLHYNMYTKLCINIGRRVYTTNMPRPFHSLWIQIHPHEFRSYIICCIRIDCLALQQCMRNFLTLLLSG